jgi:hypothetical protein
MEAEEILDRLLREDDDKEIDYLLTVLKKCWVYFFYNEANVDTPPGEGNIEKILFIDKENPIIIPMIKNENGCNGVLYTSSDLAKRCAEFSCKIGKMKGQDAFKMFYGIREVDSVAIQGDCGHVTPSRKEFAKLANSNSKA